MYYDSISKVLFTASKVGKGEKPPSLPLSSSPNPVPSLCCSTAASLARAAGCCKGRAPKWRGDEKRGGGQASSVAAVLLAPHVLADRMPPGASRRGGAHVCTRQPPCRLGAGGQRHGIHCSLEPWMEIASGAVLAFGRPFLPLLPPDSASPVSATLPGNLALRIDPPRRRAPPTTRLPPLRRGFPLGGVPRGGLAGEPGAEQGYLEPVSLLCHRLYAGSFGRASNTRPARGAAVLRGGTADIRSPRHCARRASYLQGCSVGGGSVFGGGGIHVWGRSWGRLPISSLTRGSTLARHAAAARMCPACATADTTKEAGLEKSAIC